MPTYGGAVTRDAEGRWTAHGIVAHPDGTHTRTNSTDGTTRATVWAGVACDLRAVVVQSVAERFSQYLVRDIGEAAVREVIRCNQADEAKGIFDQCHSHGFCDANMTMYEAMQSLGIDHTDNAELWDAAWNMAHTHGFYLSVKAPRTTTRTTTAPSPRTTEN